MSLLRHILVLSLIFATHQTAKLADDPTTPEPDTSDTANFSFDRKNGSLTLRISMEKAECSINDKVNGEKKLETSKNKTLPSSPGLNAPEERSKVLGALPENPAKSCDDVEESGKSYISSPIPNLSIRVECDTDNKSTCLIVKGNQNKIEESAISSKAITLSEELWLSQTTFDVQSLYNKDEGLTGTDIPQISHLLSTSVKVSQKIRYYYSIVKSDGVAITTSENTKVKSLKALLWNGQSVGSEITKQMPMKFTVGETEPCWGGDDWMCTVITFEANSNNRLPVTDFYIEDVRIKSPEAASEAGVTGTGTPVQKLYFELVELCFFHYSRDE